MQSDGFFKHLAVAALIAVVFYVVGFGWIQHRREFRGPWEITFLTDAAGRPALMIAETNLNIAETIVFPGQTAGPANLSRKQTFTEAVTDLPFGKMIFQDPTFLPGAVTMNQFGHEIELLPRVLIVDKKEIPWTAGRTVEVR